MKSIINMTCSNPNCDVEGTVELAMNVNRLSSEKIRHKQPCPKCGGELSAPSGTYERNEEGILIRVGDYTK